MALYFLDQSGAGLQFAASGSPLEGGGATLLSANGCPLSGTMRLTFALANSFDTPSAAWVNGIEVTAGLVQVDAQNLDVPVPYNLGVKVGAVVPVYIVDANGNSNTINVTVQTAPNRTLVEFTSIAPGSIAATLGAVAGEEALYLASDPDIVWDVDGALKYADPDVDPGPQSITYSIIDLTGFRDSEFVLNFIEPGDTIPAPFNIAAVNGVDPGAVNVQSVAFTPLGYDTNLDILASPDAGLEYRVSTDGGFNYGAWASVDTNVQHVAGLPVPVFQVRMLAGPAAFGVSKSLDFTYGGVAASFVVTARDPIPVVITASPADLTVSEGGTVLLAAAATGALSWQWYKNGAAIPGATSASHAIAAAALTDAGDYYAIATGENGATAQTTTATLSVAAGNNPPVVTAPADITLEFANGGAGLLKTNANLVAWAASGTGTDTEDGSVAVTADLSALPATIPVGDYTITFSATDSGGLTGSDTAVLMVREAVAVNDPPVSSGNYTSQSATVGSAFSFDAGINFSDTDTLTFSAANLPAGLSINPATGTVSGVPTTAAGVTVVITATDTAGQTATAVLPIVVSDPPTVVVLFPIKRTVVWDEVDTPDLIIGDPFSHLVTLMQGVEPAAFSVSSAESIKVAVVALDHSQAYCSAELQSNSEPGANWGAGIVSVLLSEQATSEISQYINRRTLVQLEIQVVLSGRASTWFAPVYAVPGHVT